MCFIPSNLHRLEDGLHPLEGHIAVQLAADVTAAYDPNFADVYEKRNSAFVNYGMGLCKYTGARGKSGASDASAEVVAKARRILDSANVVWQMAELGKVDAGGGGSHRRRRNWGHRRQ